MSKIYVNQTSLKIRLTTGVDISSAITKQIRYVKPDGTTGNLTATEESAEEGIINYTCASDDEWLDQAGEWSFYAYIKFSDGREAVGEPVLVTIYEEGK